MDKITSQPKAQLMNSIAIRINMVNARSISIYAEVRSIRV